MKRFLTPYHLLLGISLLAYLALIYDRVSPYVGGSDSSGYLNSALLLEKGAVNMPPRELPGLEESTGHVTTRLYTPMGFIPSSAKVITPTYPIGVPILILATAKVTGWTFAPGWVAGWNMLLGVIAFYALARAFRLPPGWSFFGTLILALSPLYLSMGLQPMSDVPAQTWCTLAILFSLWTTRDPRWAFAAGFAMGLAVLIRPSNILLIAPLAIALGLNWQRWLWLVLGGLPWALVLGCYNARAYGDALTSGYGNMSAAFSSEWFWPSVKNYATWLPFLFTPIVFLALALPIRLRKEPRETTLLILWIAVFFGVYAFYFCTPTVWWYLRFILPAVPALLVGALLIVRQWTEHLSFAPFAANSRLGNWACTLLLLAAVVTLSLKQTSRLNALNGKPDDRSYFKTAEWLNQNAPANSAVLTMQSSGSMYAYSPFVVLRWDEILPAWVPYLEEHFATTQRPLYAVLYPFEEQDTFARLPGDWREVFQYRWAKIYRREAPAKLPSPAEH